MSMSVPFVSLKHSNDSVRSDILSKINQVLDSNWFITGKFCSSFEREYAEFNKVKHCVGVGNGLDALVIALRCLGVKDGDEVILPANSFIATALAVSYVGAKPVLVDPSEKTYNLRADAVERAITSKTKAIIPVHLYGQACEMSDILALALKKGLHVVEDNAQAQGAAFAGNLTGTMGVINCTSFYPGKNLGAMGDAGAITTNVDDHAKRAAMIRSYGSSVKYSHEVKGQNSRLDEIQAAILSSKLTHLNEWNRERQRIAAFYDRELAGVGDLLAPEVAKNATHVYHLYVVRTHRRDALMAYLREQGIETLIHYPIPIHLQKAYSELNLRVGSLPVAEELAATSVSIPLYPGISQDQMEMVVEAIKRFYRAT